MPRKSISKSDLNLINMPQSRELQNKKNTHKDRQSRGPAGSGAEPKKHGAGGHNWGNALDDYQHPTTEVVDRADPNYDSSDEAH